MAQKDTTRKVCDNCGEPLEELNQNCSYHHRIKTSLPLVESPARSESTEAAPENPAEYEIVAAPPRDDKVHQGVVEETKPGASGDDMRDTLSPITPPTLYRVFAFFKLITDHIEWLDKKLDWLLPMHTQKPDKENGGKMSAEEKPAWKKWAVRTVVIALLVLAGYFLRSWRDRSSSPTRTITRKPSIKAIKLLGDPPIKMSNPAFVYAEVEGGGDTNEIKCDFSSSSNGVYVTPEVGPKCTAKIEVRQHQSPIKIDLTATNASGETDTHSETFEVRDKESGNFVLFGIDILYPSLPVKRGDKVELIARFHKGVDERDFTCEWACRVGHIVSAGHNTASFYTGNLSNNDYKNGVVIWVMAKNSRGITVDQKDITIKFQSPQSRKPTPTPSPQSGGGPPSQVKPPG